MPIASRLLPIVILIVACGGDDDAGGDIDGGSGDEADAGADGGALVGTAPICVIDGPADGAETGFDVEVTLDAAATDAEDGALTGASVVWRSDLEVTPLGTGDMLATVLPLGTNVVTCTVTDSDLNTASASVTIVAKTPYAQINHPAEGDLPRTTAEDVPFVGIGRDVEDGDLQDDSLVWISDLDGQIGTGESFEQALSAGTHTITLTATDTDANSDNATVTVEVTEP